MPRCHTWRLIPNFRRPRHPYTCLLKRTTTPETRQVCGKQNTIAVFLKLGASWKYRWVMMVSLLLACSDEFPTYNISLVQEFIHQRIGRASQKHLMLQVECDWWLLIVDCPFTFEIMMVLIYVLIIKAMASILGSAGFTLATQHYNAARRTENQILYSWMNLQCQEQIWVFILLSSALQGLFFVAFACALITYILATNVSGKLASYHSYWIGIPIVHWHSCQEGSIGFQGIFFMWITRISWPAWWQLGHFTACQEHTWQCLSCQTHSP